MHLLRVVNELPEDRFEVHLALAKPGGTYEAHLSGSVVVHDLGVGELRSSSVRMIRAVRPLRRLIEREGPDALISVMDHANLAALRANRRSTASTRQVLCVQVAPSAQYGRRLHPYDRLILFGLRRQYPKADKVIALSEGVKADLLGLGPGAADKVSVIPNAGLDERVLNGATESLGGAVQRPKQAKLIVACGRLSRQKGFVYLLRAFKKVKEEVAARLWIVGEGELRRALEEEITRLDLNGCVRLLGFQENPFKYMAAADVFVLSSLWEGFGNVLVEAMACRTPIISTDCPYGPSEIIRHEHSGLLTPVADADALAYAIVRVLKDEGLSRRLVRNGVERARDFEAGAVAMKYAEVIEAVVQANPGRIHNGP